MARRPKEVKLPYYPWWVSDYNGDGKVLAMTKLQDLAYRRLLDQSWELGPLPNEPEKLAVLIRYSIEEFKDVWNYPLSDCWEEIEGGRLINPRLEKEREHVLDRIGKARKAGLASGKSRKKKGERMLNGRSTDVELGVNYPEPDIKILSNSKNLNNIKDRDHSKGGGAGLPLGDQPPPAKPRAVTGRVKWIEKDNEQKLEASEKFRAEFLACWKKYFSVEEIKEQIEKATRWLVPRPKRRGSKSRLDIYLHNWMEGALDDKRNMEEEEDKTARRVPERDEPKWCVKCHDDLPGHLPWCPEAKGKEHDPGGKEGTTPKPRQGPESGSPGS